MPRQLELDGIQEIAPGISAENVTFQGASTTPYYRWYPYLEGFSPEFVRGVLDEFMADAERIIDPFAGTAVTGFVAAEEGRHGLLCELNPVMQRLFSARSQARQIGPDKRRDTADFLREVGGSLPSQLNAYPADEQLRESYRRCFGDKSYFPEANLERILHYRSLVDHIVAPSELSRKLLDVAGVSSLLGASKLKRAGDVRYMTEDELAAGLPTFVELVQEKINEISADLDTEVREFSGEVELVAGNVTKLEQMPSLELQGLVTSPPYVNGTNYFRNTRLELWFTRCIDQENDLRWFRDRALTAGINGVTKASRKKPPNDAVADVVRRLEDAYDRRIHQMVAAYFAELTDVFDTLSRHFVDGARIAVDIGDSLYAGVHVPADELLAECLQQVGYEPTSSVTLRTRHSNTGEKLKQALLTFEWDQQTTGSRSVEPVTEWKTDWTEFKDTLPHQDKPYSKRSWGSYLHSLCSYPGKLKPAVAHHLVRIFTDESARLLDPFAGVGTIPLEAAINGRKAFGFELSPAAYVVAQAKVKYPTARDGVQGILARLREHIADYRPSEAEMNGVENFGLNGKIAEYYHDETLREVLAARDFFRQAKYSEPAVALAMAGCLHILHGNRPYALSRRSHPLTPYSPSGDFEYKSLMSSLTEKLERTAKRWEDNGDGLWEEGDRLTEGDIYLRDATDFWPTDVEELDAVVTSPPFYDSTRFHTQNWLRLWFAGWSPSDFNQKPNAFIDERQKETFRVYEDIFRQARERLKPEGVVVFHLGKSDKCDMASEISEVAEQWFSHQETFDESVAHLEAHGMRDKGTTSSHQYLIAY